LACGARRVASGALVEEHVGLGVVHLRGGGRALKKVRRETGALRGLAAATREAGAGRAGQRGGTGQTLASETLLT